MLESYEVGQELTGEDFIDDWYFPEGKWIKCVIEDIDDDTVTVRYYGIDGNSEEVNTWTRAEFAEMLGWDMKADDNSFDIETMMGENGNVTKESLFY